MKLGRIRRRGKGELANAKTKSWDGLSFFKELEVILKDGGQGGENVPRINMEPGLFGCGWIVNGIRQCGKEFGLYIISKKHEKQLLRWFKTCWGLSCREEAAGGKDRSRDHQEPSVAAPASTS